jgi:hypothetical protein
MPALVRLVSAWALLLAAQLNEARATRARAVVKSSAVAQRLRQPADDHHALNPTRVAAAVADLFNGNSAVDVNKNTPLALQAACADLMRSQVDGLDKAYTDVHVKEAVSDACDQRRLFAAANKTTQRANCMLFAADLAASRRARLANGSNISYSQFCQEYTTLALAAKPKEPDMDDIEDEAEEDAAISMAVFLMQLIFASCYYCMVVSKYPRVDGTEDLAEGHPARELQSHNEVMGLPEVSASICLMSFCCPATRMSHNLHSTNTLNFWPSLCIMLCFPLWGVCCTLFIANSCTSMNEKLGGERNNICMGLLCAWLCQCCVIAQDAESLDLVKGVKTGICSVTEVEKPFVPKGEL